MNGKLLVVLFGLFITAVIPCAVAAGLNLPGEFYGNISINNLLAPTGILVEARINNLSVGSLITTTAGSYGGPGNFDPRLIVSGDTSGQIITFYIGGIRANQTAAFQSGISSRLDLAIITADRENPVNLTSTTAPTPTMTAVTRMDDYLYFYLPINTLSPIITPTISEPAEITPLNSPAPNVNESPTLTPVMIVQTPEETVTIVPQSQVTTLPETTGIPPSQPVPATNPASGSPAGICLALLAVTGFLVLFRK